MARSFEDFCNVSEEAIHKLLRSTYSRIGDYEKSDKSPDAIRSILFLTQPKTIKSLQTMLSIFKKYANYIEDQSLVKILNSIDCDTLFDEIVCEYGFNKFFTYPTYEEVLSTLSDAGVLNSLYLRTLFMAIYEGVYSRDFKALSNLKGSDIREGVVRVTTNAGSYTLAISEDLSSSLAELARISVWTRKGRWHEVDVQTEGKNPDSCFKVEKRNRRSRVSDENATYKNVYRRIIREDLFKNLGYKPKANDIYFSGLLHRMSLLLEDEGFTLEDAYASPVNPSARSIIKRELDRCHYGSTLDNFLKNTAGHLAAFSSSNTDLLDLISQVAPSRIQDEEDVEVAAYKGLNLSLKTAGKAMRETGPLPKKQRVLRNDRLEYPRDKKVAIEAIHLAKCLCEADSSHKTFISRYADLPYVEPHHLIPLAYSDCFDFDLDVAPNIVALCSNCHNQIHYGRDRIDLLHLLYKSRRDRLKNAGIAIEFEELLKIYGIA